MGAQPNKDELTNVDCGQESRMLKECPNSKVTTCFKRSLAYIVISSS